MTKEFNSIEEIDKYYDEKTDTYVFKEDDKMIDLVVFNFDLDIYGSIFARDIKAKKIDAKDINAWNIVAINIFARDIRAFNIKAKNITYYAVCFAYYNIKCKTIKGIRKNAKHFVLDGKIEFIQQEKRENN